MNPAAWSVPFQIVLLLLFFGETFAVWMGFELARHHYQDTETRVAENRPDQADAET